MERREDFELQERAIPSARPHQQSVTLAQEIMTRELVSVRRIESLAAAAGKMREGSFRHLPVVEEQSHRLVGLLSDRDLLRQPDHNLPVEVATSKALLTAMPDTPIRLLAQTMLDNRVNCVPVCDLYGNLVGLVTSTDIVRLCVTRAPSGFWKS